ncbi:MAG: hypothetical protein IMW93_01225 [Thermoanaerobacteraceae bacterium]|uniref:Uncharacterized protein n=1 Tax=Desulfofundulus thermobenzoicus TaxID=29376 RepID=A0A6N7IPC3_9FIRM|nr:hypothetical protein [Desulfofundulus thermobenzoicus]MBE3587179.1 hypothetical protein [Thermoanaerobacteraceae bacterium]MQL51751.1 hypothetical protein [Desulfofundulus thermobenzoicus]HHW44930.1 hypothetical protein [Desulfotomaculum sp.]
MDHEKLPEIKSKLGQALALIKEGVDESLPLLGDGPGKEITAMWEDFLREFLAYIKQKSRETRRNLFASISFHRIWPK